MKDNNKQKGFTLIEAMIAILILTMFLSVAYKVASDSFEASFFASDRVTAFYLAQEIIENVKTLQATNRLADDNEWLAGFEENCDGNWCVVDKFDGVVLRDIPLFESCGSNFEGCGLGFNNGVYDDNEGENTTFKRAVKLENINDEEAELKVRVEWQTVGKTFSSEFTTYLYDW